MRQEGEPWHGAEGESFCLFRMVVGSTLAMLGFTMFSYASLAAKRRHQRSAAGEPAAAKTQDVSDAARLLPMPQGSQLPGKRLPAVYA